MESRITATELARRLGDVLGQVRYRGDSFVIERHGVAVARLAPIQAADRRRSEDDDPLVLALRDHFARHRPPGLVAAYLFGSRARGTACPDSDVDVALLFDRAAQPSAAARDRAAARHGADLVAATHRGDVDVVVLNDAPPELAATVVRDGRPLYTADAAAERAFARYALLRHADLLPFLERTRRLKLRALAR